LKYYKASWKHNSNEPDYYRDIFLVVRNNKIVKSIGYLFDESVDTDMLNSNGFDYAFGVSSTLNFKILKSQVRMDWLFKNISEKEFFIHAI